MLVSRPHGGLGPGDGSSVTDLAGADDGRRTMTVRAVGPRWQGVDLTVLAG